MPAAPRLKTPLLIGLAEELRFAPKPAVVKDIARAIETVGLLDPAARYPADWIIFRLTGYRREQQGELESLDGKRLLAELSRLIEVLSAQSKLSRADAAPLGDGFAQAELAKRWNVSRKSLERYRAKGLLAVRLLGSRGRSELFFPRTTTEAFERANAEALTRAAGFKRLSSDEQSAIRARAGKLRGRAGATRTKLAAHLSRRARRSPGAIARLLPRTSRKRARTQPKARSLLLEKWESGVGVGDLARDSRKSRPAIVRLLNLTRADRLEQWDPSTRIPPEGVPSPGWSLERIAREFPLAASVVAPPPEPDLQSLLDAMALREAPDRTSERQLVRAHHACMQLACAPARSAEALDQAETCLRWCAKLRAALLRPYRAVIVESIESLVGLEILRGDPALLTDALLRALAAAANGLELFAPAPASAHRAIGGTLAAPVGLAANRALTDFVRTHERDIVALRARAGARAVRSIAGAPAPDWTESVSPWQRVLIPPSLRRPREAGETAEILRERFGLAATRPHTIAELAATWKSTRIAAARRVQHAIHHSLA